MSAKYLALIDIVSTKQMVSAGSVLSGVYPFKAGNIALKSVPEAISIFMEVQFMIVGTAIKRYQT